MKKIKYLVLFLVGFCVYITIEVCFRCYSYPLMGVCGGLLLLLLDPLNDKVFGWDTDLLLQGTIGSAIVTLMELVIGKTYQYFNLTPMWDYSNIPLNYDGIICLPFSLIWIGLSIVGILLIDTINYYVFKQLPTPYYKMFGKTIIQFKDYDYLKETRQKSH